MPMLIALGGGLLLIMGVTIKVHKTARAFALPRKPSRRNGQVTAL